MAQIDSTAGLGSDNTATVTRLISGGTFYHPIPGYMIRTRHTVPQVKEWNSPLAVIIAVTHLRNIFTVQLSGPVSYS